MHMSQQPYVWGTKGIIEPRKEKDKWDNDVSIITTPSYTYRMVHHTPVEADLQRATCYAGRRFLKLRSVLPEDITLDHTIEFGGYSIKWNMGTAFDLVQRPDGPKGEWFMDIECYNEARFVIEVLDLIPMESFSKLWQIKVVPEMSEKKLPDAAVVESGFIPNFNETKRREKKPTLRGHTEKSAILDEINFMPVEKGIQKGEVVLVSSGRVTSAILQAAKDSTTSVPILEVPVDKLKTYADVRAASHAQALKSQPVASQIVTAKAAMPKDFTPKPTKINPVDDDMRAKLASLSTKFKVKKK